MVFGEMVARIGITGVLTSVALMFAAALSPAAWGTFPGQDGRIAFTSDGGPGTPPSIATMEPDGSQVRDLTRGYSPAWSADGKRIVFSRTAPHGTRSDLYVMRADGSHVRRLTFTAHRWEGRAAFSPNGRKIVFGRLEVGILVMRLDDLRTRFVTADGVAPEWAPNGRRIVFVDQQDSAGGIATIRPDGTHERRLTSPPNAFDAYPAYAPDGRTIYFNRFPWRGPVGLMRVGAFGGQLQRVPTPTPAGGLLSPAPAPAGGCIIGTGSRGGPEELYARGGRCPTQGWLREGDQPSWQPLPNG